MPRHPQLVPAAVASIALAVAGALACGGGGGGGGVDRFTKACMTATNMDEPLCECAGEKAADRLSAGAFDLLVAMLEKDEETVNRLRGELPLSETMAAGMFMTSGPAECANEMPPQ